MRTWLPATTTLILLATLPGLAQDPTPENYQVEIEKVYNPPLHEGKKGLWVTVQFKVKRRDGALTTDLGGDQVVVEEDGRTVAEVQLYPPRAAEDLTAVLALDTSGSMAEHGKIQEARQAAGVFLSNLHEKSDCGLILFNHETHTRKAPAGLPREPERMRKQRREVTELVNAAPPVGGTAYLDATSEALTLLHGVRGRRAVVVMTDGVDLNSRRLLPEVIEEAQRAEVPVYTIGVGEPGKNESISTVLVLDHSLSMTLRAEDRDDLRKFEALHRAASRFVDFLRPSARVSLLPFSSRPETPQPFTNDKERLKQGILALRPDGQTALFDATNDAVETLLADRAPGKRVVVVLTDGIDEGSRRNPREVSSKARKAQIPIFMLGLGRKGEIDEKVMKLMASETGGEYYHAQNQQRLFEIFENLALKLYDDGIDEASLQQLARQTGGRYTLARNVADLRLRYQELADELQTTYTVTFPSRRPSHDGTARGIRISILRQGVRVSDIGTAGYQVHGVVVPDMHPGVYLVLLVFLGALLAAPAGLRRLQRGHGA